MEYVIAIAIFLFDKFDSNYILLSEKIHDYLLLIMLYLLLQGFVKGIVKSALKERDTDLIRCSKSEQILSRLDNLEEEKNKKDEHIYLADRDYSKNDLISDGEDDDLYEDAKQTVIEAGKASTSYIQRKLRVDYARAARLMDILEARGVIGSADGARPREVYREKDTTNQS